MGNCYTTENRKKKTPQQEYSNGLDEDYRTYTTKKGNTYMLWNNRDNGDILAYLIKGIHNDIEYETGPRYFNQDGGGAFEQGDIAYHTFVIFRRRISFKNILIPIGLKGYSHELVWFPFMPKSARLARNLMLFEEQQKQQKEIEMLVKEDTIQLRKGDFMWIK